jgi:hypothetical protein
MCGVAVDDDDDDDDAAVTEGASINCKSGNNWRQFRRSIKPQLATCVRKTQKKSARESRLLVSFMISIGRFFDDISMIAAQSEKCWHYYMMAETITIYRRRVPVSSHHHHHSTLGMKNPSIPRHPSGKDR